MHIRVDPPELAAVFERAERHDALAVDEDECVAGEGERLPLGLKVAERIVRLAVQRAFVRDHELRDSGCVAGPRRPPLEGAHRSSSITSCTQRRARSTFGPLGASANVSACSSLITSNA